MKKILLGIAFTLGVFISANAADVPVFPGGDTALNSYISSNLKYPEAARENGVEGVVAVGFIVLPDGSLTEVKVIKLVDPDLEKEALRLVNAMPAWIPADKDGAPVEAPAKVEIPFVIDD